MNLNNENERNKAVIPNNQMDLFGNPDMEHVDRHNSQSEIYSEILVNNQPFRNHVLVKKEEQKKEEELPIPVKKALQPKHRHKRQSVYEPTFTIKINKLAGNELPNQSPFSFLASKLKQSLVGLTEEQADQLLRVDESHPEMSNLDVILAKPGAVIKK